MSEPSAEKFFTYQTPPAPTANDVISYSAGREFVITGPDRGDTNPGKLTEIVIIAESSWLNCPAHIYTCRHYENGAMIRRYYNNPTNASIRRIASLVRVYGHHTAPLTSSIGYLSYMNIDADA